MPNKENTYQQLKKIELETEKKGNLTYSSWASVWDKVLEIDPEATFEVAETEKGFPAFINITGGMVKVTVTINKKSKTCWLPVMNYANKALKKETMTSMDINKTIQRCMVKAVALFGLGLYIYKGEDIPPNEDEKEIN